MVNRCCLGRLHGWVFWQLLTALLSSISSGHLLLTYISLSFNFFCNPLAAFVISHALIHLFHGSYDWFRQLLFNNTILKMISITVLLCPGLGLPQQGEWQF